MGSVSFLSASSFPRFKASIRPGGSNLIGHRLPSTHIEIEPVVRRLLEQGSLRGEVYGVHQWQDMAMAVWTWMVARCR